MYNIKILFIYKAVVINIIIKYYLYYKNKVIDKELIIKDEIKVVEKEKSNN